MRLETKRLLLRDFTEEDAQALYAILGDAVAMRCLEPAYSPTQTETFLRTFCIGCHGALAAVDRASGTLIGYLLFHPVETEIYELGWVFNRRYWRQGFAYESCSQLICYAFQTLGAHKIIAETIDIEKSVPLMKKLGMRQEGVQRAHRRDWQGKWADLYLYGLLREEYRQQAT